MDAAPFDASRDELPVEIATATEFPVAAAAPSSPVTGWSGARWALCFCRVYPLCICRLSYGLV
jgi:hypothetical protein